MPGYIKKLGRKAYKATGYKNPYKKGKLQPSRVVSQLPKLARDVGSLMKMVNAEKKRIVQVSSSGQVVSQVFNDNSAHYLVDITPNPSQGVTISSKTGNSIKLHSTNFDFQFTSQANAISGMLIKIQIVKVIGLNYTDINDVMNKFVNPNKFITGTPVIYDTSSDRDPDYFKNFQILRTVYCKLPDEQIANQVSMIRKRFGIKYKNHHIRTNDDTTSVSMGQIFMLITADRGNSGNTASTRGRIPITQANTGVGLEYANTHYYYDN